MTIPYIATFDHGTHEIFASAFYASSWKPSGGWHTQVPEVILIPQFQGFLGEPWHVDIPQILNTPPPPKKMVQQKDPCQTYHHKPNQKKTLPSWWFQPLWKILVKMGIFTNFRGENPKNLWNKPPSCIFELIWWTFLCSCSTINLQASPNSSIQNVVLVMLVVGTNPFEKNIIIVKLDHFPKFHV